jgi:hypothetical protein
MAVSRLLAYAWALPTTALGLLALVLASVAAPLAGRVRTRVVEGVLELHGGLVTRFLSRCTPLPAGASAMTLGHVVLGRDQQALDASRPHERVHVRQCERWGPLFITAYLLASAVLWARGRDFYEENPFEREAYGTCP